MRKHLASFILICTAVMAMSAPRASFAVSENPSADQLRSQIGSFSKSFALKLDSLVLSNGKLSDENGVALKRMAKWLEENRYPRIKQFLDALSQDDAMLVLDVFRKGSDIKSNELLPIIESLEAAGQKTAIGFPFHGIFYVVQGNGGSISHNKGSRDGFAWDFIVMRNGTMFAKASHKNENYFAWRLPVVSPAAGKAVKTRNDMDDHPPLTTKMGGANFAIIEHEPGEFSLIYHMNKGSVAVKIGDTVKRGDPVGLIGDSGTSMFPHIHYSLDKGTPDDRKPFSSRFACYFFRRDEKGPWRLAVSGIPEQGDFLIGADDYVEMISSGK